MENILELKTVNNLRDINFFIPSYQRGFRWTTKEVIDLLNDIDGFNPKQVNEQGEKTWYCLQPIVVKKKSLGEYEVIDGQQRLTTIYLILYYLNQLYTEDYRERLFQLNYETRPNSHEYLKKLKRNEENNENVDYHHINDAYNAICEWFTKSDFDRNNFQSKFKFNTRVIWYESVEADPIAIFTRINIGKIPLTNAELIKALFLNSSNFDNSYIEKIRLKQLEISTEWDSIEHSLQNDRFWYFINGGNDITNRIEFIFNLMNSEKDYTDNYSTFRYFNKKFQNKTKDTIAKNWIEIKNYYQKFEEWFNERELYHKIGYLIAIEGETIENILAVSSRKTKKEFISYLDGLIRDNLKKISLDNLQYGDKEVKKILLLYNIITMLNNEKDNSLFPFDIYKNGKWDIEHITSVNDSVPDTLQQKQRWLEDARLFVEEKSIKDKIDNCDSDQDFNEVFYEIIAYFNKEIKDQDINDISNLTLLDSETNRGYKNAVFPIKRMTIIKREKEGAFIPLCTKNVFLKYFSDYPPKISFWSQEDRENYYKDLDNTLKFYLPINDKENK